MTKTEAEIQREREEKGISLAYWSRLDIHRWSDDPKVNEVVEKVYELMEGLEGFSGKSNIQKKPCSARFLLQIPVGFSWLSLMG